MQFCSVDITNANGNHYRCKNVVLANNIAICYNRPIANHVYYNDIERVY